MIVFRKSPTGIYVSDDFVSSPFGIIRKSMGVYKFLHFRRGGWNQERMIKILTKVNQLNEKARAERHVY